MAILGKSKRLKKELTLFNIYTIATGATIASGFFLLPGLAFASAGPGLVLSYIIAAIPVIPALFSTSELSTAMPRAGGVYFFLDRSMGPLVGTIGGLGTWLALVLKTAFALVGIGAYMGIFISEIPVVPLATAFAVLFGLVNLFGAKKAGVFQGILVVGLLALLAMFSITGLLNLSMKKFPNIFNSDFNSVFATAGLVYVSYVGLSKIASVSEEVKEPEKNIPKAMFLALITAVIIYTIGTIVMINVIPAEIFSGDLTPVATSAELMMGHWGAILMTVAAILAFFSVANAGILSCSRYPLAMSRDHLLPVIFKKFNKFKTPGYSIIISVLIIILILNLFDPTKIAKLAGAFQLLLFSMISLAVIVMRESKLESYDPGFKSPLYPWMQIFGIIAPGWLIIEMGMLPSLFSLALIGFGIVWYFYYAQKRIVRSGAVYHIFARLGQHKFDGLETELRGILKEKGLREQDPFDAVVASSSFIDDSDAKDFEDIVTRASKLLAEKIQTDPKVLIKNFLEGTQIGATPVSHGAALPHVRIEGIRRSELIMIRSKTGVPVDVESEFLGERERNEPIFAFFFLASPEENPGQHLRILAQIASHVDDEKFINKWLAAKNEQELKELLLRDDRYISIVIAKEKPSAELIGREIKNLQLPTGSLVALIHRNGEMIVPKGNTVLYEKDRLTIIGYPEGIKTLFERYKQQ